jgi:hypothetical protein
LYLVLAVLAVIGLVIFFVVSRRGAAPVPSRKKTDQLDTVTGWQPQATRVLSNIERKAFETLRSAFPAHIILAQVPLARFIKVPTRNSYAEWLRRAGQLCADLVVCDRYSQVIAVVELRRNDESTDARLQKRQQRLIRVLKAADVPVHEWAEHAMPSVEQAREAIMPTPPMPLAPEAAAGTAPAPTSTEARPMSPVLNPLAEEARDSTQDEVIEMREPPPSTWFDEMDTEAAALEQTQQSRTGRYEPPARRS